MKTTSSVWRGLTLVAGIFASSFASGGSAPIDSSPSDINTCAGQPDGTACDVGNVCDAEHRCQSGVCVVSVRFTHPVGSPIAVGAHPIKAVLPDVNRDGKPDLLTLDTETWLLETRLGNGNGGFGQLMVSGVVSHGQSLTVNDFNRDGNPDVVSIQQDSGYVRVFIGHGDGTFSTGFATPFLLPGIPEGIASGDVNGDGKPDLVTTLANGQQIFVLLNDFNDGFVLSAGSPFVGGRFEPVLRDFNLDGKLDIAVPYYVSPQAFVSIFLGTGASGFTPAPGSPVPIGTSAATSLAAGDFNGDGKPDIAAVGQLYVKVLLGDGSGRFTPYTVLSAPSGSNRNFVRVSVADFNADGKSDLVVLDYTKNEIIILIGDGSGGFQELHDPSFGIVSTPYSVPVGDINLDGKPDLAVANYLSNTMTIFLNDVHVQPAGTVCFDGNACTGTAATPDSCDGAGACLSGPALSCDDNHACTDDSCDPSTGCVHVPHSNACDDGDACTNDACDPAVGCVHTLVTCIDGNACNGVETCDPAQGCLPGTPLSCDDLNACNGVESCSPSTGCVAGGPLNCNDGNACNGVESCSSATGCVPGTPVICAPPDQCHEAGVCQPTSGVCDYANKADGTACDDGDPSTTNDVCTSGVCAGSASCATTPTPKPSGYYKKLCKDGHGNPSREDALTDADAVCVGQLTATFAGFSTVADICGVFAHDSDGQHHDSNGPQGKECQKAEQELLALALNICRDRVCLTQEVDSNCSGDPHDHTLTLVSDSLATTDAILSNPNRDKTTCHDGRCLAREINNGKGLHHTSLMISKIVGQPNAVRLTWDNPVFDDGRHAATSYTVWRRVLQANALFTQLDVTTNPTFTDNTAGTGTWEYEVTFTIEP